MYDIEATRCGVFCSALERKFFVWFRQQTSHLSYVGHVDYWRDFIVCGDSIEIKPSGLKVSTQELLSVVGNRVPRGERLALLIGEPDSHLRFQFANGVWNGVS